MKHTDYLKKKKNREIRKRIISVLSALVVFVATYALVLPALTLDVKTARMEPGMSVQQEADPEAVTAPEAPAEEETVEESTKEEEPAEAVEPEKEEKSVKEESEKEDQSAQAEEQAPAEEASKDKADEAAQKEDAGQADADSAAADQAPAKNDSSSETVDQSGADAAEENTKEAAAEAFKVPELEAIDFSEILTDKTDFYYYHADKDEDAAAVSSTDIDDWKKATKDTVLAPEDFVRVYLAYSIPAGALNETNTIAAYRLPDGLELTDKQIKAINKNENGISGTDKDAKDYKKYLGAEAIEGTRTPDKTRGDDEYISATVKVEKVYENDKYIGQDLLFTFAPYTVQKNQISYDDKGNVKSEGKAVKGWFTFDLTPARIDFEETEDAAAENGLVRSEAKITFVKENNKKGIDEISRALTLDAPAGTDADKTEEKAKQTAEQKTLTYEGADYTVVINYTDDAQIPDNAELTVSEIEKDTPEYNDYLEQAKAAVKEDKEEKTVNEARFFDITILADGEKVEPAAPVNVQINFAGIEQTKAEDAQLLHYKDDKNVEVMDKAEFSKSEEAENEEKAVDTVQFETDGFSVFGIVGTESITVDYLTDEGSTYEITVDLTNVNNIPANAELKVDEILPDHSKYEEYVDGAAEAVRAKKDEISFARVFDISIMANGREIEPDGTVSVNIRLKGEKLDTSAMSTVHFTEGGPKVVVSDVNEVEKKTQEISFDTDSFSVYVVVETTTPRLTVNFKNGSSDIASMIIKEADTADEVEKIIYDPGAGTLGEGEVFKGWTTDQNYTSESTLLTIEQVRSAARTAAAELDGHDGSVTYYAAIFKTHTITYLSDDEEPITVGTASVEYPAYDTTGEVSYTVNMGYTVDDGHNFEGWVPDAASQDNIKNYPDNATSETVTSGSTTSTIYYYENGTEITITGDVTFTVRAPEGNWLIFDENGKGATYTAPQFVLKGDVTKTPSTLNTMARNGYTFGGWYDTAEHAAAHAADTSVTEGAFTFGNELSENTTIYASWVPRTTASYTILVWKQNISGTGYDFAESRVLDGTVGENVSSVVQHGSGNDAYASINGTPLQYTGFHLATFSPDVEIVPEGTSVVNIYYDRNIYALTFEVRRESGTQYRYTRDDTSGNWGYVDDTWVELGTEVIDTTTVTEYYLAQTEGASYENRYTGTVYTNTNGNTTNSPVYPNTYYRRTGGPGNRIYHELYWCSREVSVDTIGYSYTDSDGNTKTYTGPRFTRTTVNSGNGWYTVKAIVERYEENISSYFPIVGTNGTTYTDSRWDPQSSTPYNQVLVYIDVMPAADVTFHQSTANYTTKHMYYYVEALEGETEDTRTYNGKEFVLYKQLDANYNYFTEAEDYIDLVGFSKSNSYPPEGYQSNGTTRVNTIWSNSSAIHVYCYYLRDSYQINYMDGVYVDGDNNVLQHHETNQLTTSDMIYYGASIEDYDITPSLPAGEKGYVFEGWYMDEACTQEYNFNTTMPVGGVTVYAKWRQVQYRVFLHTNVTAEDESGLSDDEKLSWGSEGQAFSFRIGYGGKVSTPTGVRNGYKFLGWYTDPTFSSVFNDTAYVLNEETVTTNYSQTEATDPEVYPYGIDEDNENARNSDATGWNGASRYWITKKLDLYAKWSKVLEGADGINVEYNAAGSAMVEGETVPVTGSNAPTDNATYLDNTSVVAGAAPTPPEGYVFYHWVVATYNEDSGEYTYDDESQVVLPGGTFTISADDAKVEDLGNDKKSYTVQLIAIYKPVEEATPTHIPWYKNDGSKAFHIDTLPAGSDDVDDSTLQINAAVDIQSAPTRNGYTFLGWARVVMDDPETFEGQSQYWTQPSLIVTDRNDLGDIDMLLYYNADNNKFYTESSYTTEATKVAADEKPIYHAMFAVWEKKPTYLYIVKRDVTDEANITYLAGAGFTLSKVGDNGSTTISTLTSVATEDGVAFMNGSALLDFNNLDDGTYKLEETTIPVGYGTDFSSIEFTVSDGNISGLGIPTTDDDGNSVYKYTVDNYQVATVTVTKVVSSTEAWKATDEATPFTFTHAGESFTLYGVAADKTDTEEAHVTTKTFEGVRIGTTFDVSETANDEFTATYKVDDGEAVTGSSASVRVTGDTTITFTNTRKKVDIIVNKTAPDGTTLLNGAEFELTGSDPHIDPVRVTLTNGTYTFEGLTSGTYVLTEKKAPDGYVILDNVVTFTVNAKGTGDVITLDASVSNDTATTSGDNNNTVAVKNTAGQALPHTGGSGTLIYTLSGLALMLGAALMYGFRMRRRERRLN